MKRGRREIKWLQPALVVAVLALLVSLTDASPRPKSGGRLLAGRTWDEMPEALLATAG